MGGEGRFRRDSSSPLIKLKESDLQIYFLQKKLIWNSSVFRSSVLKRANQAAWKRVYPLLYISVALMEQQVFWQIYQTSKMASLTLVLCEARSDVVVLKCDRRKHMTDLTSAVQFQTFQSPLDSIYVG